MIDMYGREKIDELRQEARKVLTAKQKYDLTLDAFNYYTEKLKELNE